MAVRRGLVLRFYLNFLPARVSYGIERSLDIEQQLRERLLVLRYQAGDAEAFVELVARYHASLTYFVRRLAKDEATAEDIVQDVWMKSLRHLRTLRHPEAFRVWLYQVARRRVLNERRDAKSVCALPDNLPAAEDVPEEEEVFSAEQAPRVHECLNALRPEFREVLLLRFLEEMPYESIAEVIGCPVGTVRSRIHYAKLALRREMEKGWLAGFARRF